MKHHRDNPALSAEVNLTHPSRLFTHAKATCLALCAVVLVSTSASARVLEYATEDAGTMAYKIAGASSITTTTEQVRKGTYAFNHVVSGSDKRAEIDDNSWHQYGKGNPLFYGMSYFVPTTWESNLTAVVAQWRYSNLVEPGYTIPNCAINRTSGCNNAGYVGGSGWYLQVKNDRWVLFYRYAENGCATCVGMIENNIDLGPVTKGQWTDWVFKIKYSHNTDGELSIWRAVNKSAYVNIYARTGLRTWFDKYAAGTPYAGRTVQAGNFTVGHYASNYTTSHTLYTDEIKFSDYSFDEVAVKP
jgi:hypothetical protein